MDRTNPAATPALSPTDSAPPPCIAPSLPAERQGNPCSLATLERNAGATMLGAAFKVLGPRGHEAADAVQDAWCYALAHPEALAAVRPGTEVTWLAGVTRHAALNRLRRRQVRDRREVLDPEALVAMPVPAPEEGLYSPEEIDAVVAVVNQLPAPDRSLLTLALVEGLSCPEIARALGLPRTTARDRLRVALRRVTARAWRVRRAVTAG